MLVAGIPGTEPPDAADRLIEWANQHGENTLQLSLLDPRFRKFESVLLQVYNESEANPQPAQYIPLMLSLPKPILRAYWEKALQRVREMLDGSPAPPSVVLLPIHLVWYHHRHREYIGVLDTIDLPGQLCPHRIRHVLCLIDDIHDVYKRLRRPGALWDRHAASLTETSARRGHAFRRHIRILEWRAREISAAESLAGRLDCPFTLLATKHPCKVAFLCLCGDPQVYFSHPITEPRRLASSEVEANNTLDSDFRQTLWSLQQELSKHIALLQPTCIDEYRIVHAPAVPALGSRFYAHDRYTDSLYNPDECDDNVIYDDLSADPHDLTEIEIEVARDLATAASTFVENQVTARDLQLVSQSKHLLVYRPRFNGNLSGGVLEEIAHFRQVRDFRSDLEGRIIFLDSSTDRSLFAPRQLLEAFTHASVNGTWSPTLEEHCIADYLTHLSASTRDQINDLTVTSGVDSMERVIESVLRDLGLDPTWRLDRAGESVPLSDAHTFTRQQLSRGRFLETCIASITPFEMIPDYRCDQTIMIDGKTNRELVEEILAFLAPRAEQSEAL